MKTAFAKNALKWLDASSESHSLGMQPAFVLNKPDSNDPTRHA
ncbi:MULTISPECIES: hypothetical protein [Acidovorax]|nr:MULTISPECIES: hypothetical protein [Acidovorax]